MEWIPVFWKGMKIIALCSIVISSLVLLVGSLVYMIEKDNDLDGEGCA